MRFSKCVCVCHESCGFWDRMELDAAYLQVGRGGGGLGCQVPRLMTTIPSFWLPEVRDEKKKKKDQCETEIECGHVICVSEGLFFIFCFLSESLIKCA